MFNILVVDDEKHIRKGIITILRKGLEGDVEFTEASNGIQALERAETTNPCLVITDISMPGYDGLQFIEELRKKRKYVTIIVLSGYESFEYAQQAIKLGVKEYIMKPIQKVEFVDKIQHYISVVEYDKNIQRCENQKSRENYKIIERLKQDTILGCLKCPNSNEALEYLQQLKGLGISVEEKPYFCAVIQYQVTKENSDYIDYAVKNMIDECLELDRKNNYLLTVQYSKGIVVAIFEVEKMESYNMYQKVELPKVVKLIRETFKISAYIGVGDIAYDFVHLHISLRHALVASYFKIYDVNGKVCLFENIKQNEVIVPLNLISITKEMSEQAMFKCLDEFQNLYKEGKSKEGIRVLKKEYEELQTGINRYLLRKNYITDTKEGIKAFHECWTIYDLKKELKKRLELFLSVMYDAEYNTSMMQQILVFIEENVTENIDLISVANQFERTPGYISSLFKKSNKKGFNQYLTERRIEIARKLLKESKLSIQEIGEMCGYPNSKYFSVVFRKCMGEPPSDYREKNRIV